MNLELISGMIMFFFKHMLAIKKWETDMKVNIKEMKPLQVINLKVSAFLLINLPSELASPLHGGSFLFQYLTWLT